MISNKINQPTKIMLVDIPDTLNEVKRIRGESAEKPEAIPLRDDPKKTV